MTIPDKLISSCSWDEICIYILIKRSKRFPSIRVISKELSIPQTNVYRMLKRMQGLGFVGTRNTLSDSMVTSGCGTQSGTFVGTQSGTRNTLSDSMVTSGCGTQSGTFVGTQSGTRKKLIAEQKIDCIEKRKSSFEHSLSPYVTSGQYKPEMVRAFSDYWTEFNKSHTKMRWELEKTWETSKRLATWANRDSQMDTAKSTYTSYRQDEQAKVANVLKDYL